MVYFGAPLIMFYSVIKDVISLKRLATYDLWVPLKVRDLYLPNCRYLYLELVQILLDFKTKIKEIDGESLSNWENGLFLIHSARGKLFSQTLVSQGEIDFYQYCSIEVVQVINSSYSIFYTLWKKRTILHSKWSGHF